MREYLSKMLFQIRFLDEFEIRDKLGNGKYAKVANYPLPYVSYTIPSSRYTEHVEGKTTRSSLWSTYTRTSLLQLKTRRLNTHTTSHYFIWMYPPFPFLQGSAAQWDRDITFTRPPELHTFDRNIRRWKRLLFSHRPNGPSKTNIRRVVKTLGLTSRLQNSPSDDEAIA